MRRRAHARRCALLIIILAAVSAATPAHAFTNGRAPSSALSPIYIPGNTAYLAQAPAASWNVMRQCAVAQGTDIYPGASQWHPAATAYRTIGAQNVLWASYLSGKGALAARPGTSNHGAGLAVDLATLKMRQWIDRRGSSYGWAKKWSDAPSEWWHLRVRLGVYSSPPDPGVSQRYPILRKRSRGACLAPAVKEVQRRLGLKQDGVYGAGTAAAVRKFERDHGLHKTGVVDEKLWDLLRKQSRGTTSQVLTEGQTQQPIAGVDVRAAQGLLNVRLKELGSKCRVPKIDGVYGKSTESAVKCWQRARGLKVTGKIAARDWTYLRRPWRIDCVDVSEYQPTVDWGKVHRAGYECAIARVGYGVRHPDKSYGTGRVKAVRSSGLKLGVYQFVLPTNDHTGTVEANVSWNLARAGGWNPKTEPIFADIEVTPLSASATCTYAGQLLARWKQLGAKLPGVYTGPGFANAHLTACKSLASYPLWDAHYGPKTPTVPRPWTVWTAWQFTDKANVPGAGHVDASVVRGGKPQLKALFR